MEFILNLDHETLKYINSEASLNLRYANRVASLPAINIVIKFETLVDSETKLPILVCKQHKGLGFLDDWEAINWCLRT